jgi:hypothetical protein
MCFLYSLIASGNDFLLCGLNYHPISLPTIDSRHRSRDQHDSDDPVRQGTPGFLEAAHEDGTLQVMIGIIYLIGLQ